MEPITNPPTNKQASESANKHANSTPNESSVDIALDISPRAFAQGTGLVLQVIGVCLFMTTCCVCSTSFLWDPILPPDQAIAQIAQTTLDTAATNPLAHLGQLLKSPTKTGLMLSIMTCTVGGLAMAVFGLGLQSDHRYAAFGALTTNTLMLVIMAIANYALTIGHASVITRLWYAVIFLMLLILLGFTITAYLQVRQNPPPKNVDIIAPGTKIPYSMYHDDPPEVRLANELATRREKLQQEQAELEKLEAALQQKKSSNNPPTK